MGAMIDWDIPSLRSDRLAATIPTSVFGGERVTDPSHTLFIWRTAALSTARGMTVGFYVWDEKLEALWRHPERSAERLLNAGVVAVVEPDFSLWADAPLVEQLWSIYRMRSLGRQWQEAGLAVIPNLAWSDERSFPFCFTGIPIGAPVTASECRTSGGNDDDRRAFSAGLAQGVKEVQPQHVIVYGGREHECWLAERLPKGPRYTLIEAWTSARGKIRAAEERHARAKNQLTFGGEGWEDEAAAAAERNAVAAKTRDRHEERRGIHAASNSRPCRSQPQLRRTKLRKEVA